MAVAVVVTAFGRLTVEGATVKVVVVVVVMVVVFVVVVVVVVTPPPYATNTKHCIKLIKLHLFTTATIKTAFITTTTIIRPPTPPIPYHHHPHHHNPTNVTTITITKSVIVKCMLCGEDDGAAGCDGGVFVWCW